LIVIIPTGREINLDNVEPLIEHGARFIVIDDSEGSIEVPHPSFEVYNWGHRRKMLGKNEIAIPKKTGACRDFGFYIAWHSSEEDEIILSIDDDCVVENSDFGEQVESLLNHGRTKMVHGEGRQFNIFDLYSNLDSQQIFPRGFPYSERFSYKRWSFVDCKLGPLFFNLGLLKGYFDINAIDKIGLEQRKFPDAELDHEGVVIPNGSLISACSGNMHFRKSIIPAVYQLPMNVEIISPWVIDRYGDIWAGFIMKTLMDIRGDGMSVGSPLVRHLQEGPSNRNIAKEHLGHLVNEEFIRLLTRCSEEIESDSYLNMMNHLSEELQRNITKASIILQEYLRHLSPCLDAWIKILSIKEY
jgi:hypothetical protein